MELTRLISSSCAMGHWGRAQPVSGTIVLRHAMHPAALRLVIINVPMYSCSLCNELWISRCCDYALRAEDVGTVFSGLINAEKPIYSLDYRELFYHYSQYPTLATPVTDIIYDAAPYKVFRTWYSSQVIRINTRRW